MSSVGNWWVRIGAVLTTAMLSVFVPAAAWAAENGVSELAYEAARRKSRGMGGFAVIGALCCLGVVAIVVVIVLLIKRGRGRKG
ncbi:MAG TPA: hypothetical protein VF755_00640 [Catenuloplanes sp.]